MKNITLVLLAILTLTACSKEEDEDNVMTITGAWGTQFTGDLAEATGIDYYGIDFGDRIRTYYAIEGDSCGTFDSYLSQVSATETTITLNDEDGGVMVINYVSESEFSFTYTNDGAVISGNFIAATFLICN